MTKKKKTKFVGVGSSKNLESSWLTGVWFNHMNAGNIIAFLTIYITPLTIGWIGIFFLFTTILSFLLFSLLMEMRRYEKLEDKPKYNSHMWGTHREGIVGEKNNYSSDLADELGREIYFDRIFVFSIVLTPIILLKIMFYKDSQELLNRFVKYGGKYYYIKGGKKDSEVHEIKKGKVITLFMDYFRVADHDDLHAQIIRESLGIKSYSEIKADEQQSVFAALYEFIALSSSRFFSENRSLEIIRDFDSQSDSFPDIGSAIRYFETVFERNLSRVEKKTVKDLFEEADSRLDLDSFPQREKESHKSKSQYDSHFDGKSTVKCNALGVHMNL